MASSRSVSSTSCNSSTMSDFEIIENGVESLTVSTGKAATLNSRPSSSSRITQKAKRIRFYHNGNRFFNGIVIPVAPERYRSFDSLTTELTNLFTKNVTLPSGVRTIYTMDGKKIGTLEDLEDGKEYVVGGKGEIFKRIDYAKIDCAKSKRLSLYKFTTPSNPPKITPPDCVRPKIVTIIRNGLKPRKILRLLLNKRNASSFDQALIALTEVAQLDTGAVRKVYTLSGQPVLNLCQFFTSEDVFFVYGNERLNADNDFELEFEESKAIQQHKKTPGTSSTRQLNGLKPKMPKKVRRATHGLPAAVNNATPNSQTHYHYDSLLRKLGEDNNLILPPLLQAKYSVGRTIGDGNFAVVRLCKHLKTDTKYALKIIDKAKCRGKEDMIDNEVIILRRISHQNIMALIEDHDTNRMLYLVCEYVTGGDLFDAISMAKKFSEEQAALMINHLASALAYLHSINIVHRDVKPENLLVEYDGDLRIRLLKLGDFGLACEVNGPLLNVCGTPTYVAPEILAEIGYGLKIDVWAAGVILYILLCGYPPFVSADNDQESLFDCILSGMYYFPDDYWREVSDEAKELIQNMLQLQPDLRFSAEDVLDHSWLTGAIVSTTWSSVTNNGSLNYLTTNTQYALNNHQDEGEPMLSCAKD